MTWIEADAIGGAQGGGVARNASCDGRARLPLSPCVRIWGFGWAQDEALNGR